jgi:hypothetical protein
MRVAGDAEARQQADAQARRLAEVVAMAQGNGDDAAYV